MDTASRATAVGAAQRGYGRYRRPRKERWAATCLIAVALALAVFQVVTRRTTSGSDIVDLIWSCGFVSAVGVTVWFLPVTVIDGRGILRVLGRPRRIRWEEVTEFYVEKYGRSTMVFARLGDGRRVMLFDVPPFVVPELSAKIG